MHTYSEYKCQDKSVNMSRSFNIAAAAFQVSRIPEAYFIYVFICGLFHDAFSVTEIIQLQKKGL
jgi:uncharacterized membrane protein